MEATMKKSNHGLNIRRWREWRGIKQDVLADQIGISQATLSGYEKKDKLDDELLEKFAKALEIPIEALALPSEDSNINIVTGGTWTDNMGFNTNYYPTFNPIDKVVALYNDKIELYERMLKAEQEKVAMLEKIVKK